MKPRVDKNRMVGIPSRPALGRQRRSNGLRAFAVPFILVLGLSPGLGAYDLKDNREVSSREPVNISAFQLLFDRLKGLTLFKGNVKAVHDHVVLTAEEVRAVSGNREATAEGKVKVVDPTSALTMTCGNLEYLDLMNLMTAHDHPLLTSLDENGLPITVTGRQMELDSEKKSVVIHQNVRIFHGDGEGEADKATFLSKEDKFIMEGDPKLTMPNGRLSGRRIVSNLGKDRGVWVEGMADAVFYPSGKSPEPKGGARGKGPASGAKDNLPSAPGTGPGQAAAVTQTATPIPEPQTGVGEPPMPGVIRLRN